MKIINHLLVVSLLVLSASLTSCEFGQQEKAPTTYLIPNSIRGEVMIIYNYEKGEVPKMRNNKRLMDIPITRVLRTQTKPSYGLASDNYYLISEDGKKHEITIEVNTKSDTALCIYNITTGKTKVEGSEYEYEAFMVCRKDSIRFYNDFKLSIH